MISQSGGVSHCRAFDPAHGRLVSMTLYDTRQVPDAVLADAKRFADVFRVKTEKRFIPVMDAGESHGYFYVVTKPPSGQGLQDFLSGGRQVKGALVIRWLAQLAEVSYVLEQQNISHSHFTKNNTKTTNKKTSLTFSPIFQATSSETGELIYWLLTGKDYDHQNPQPVSDHQPTLPTEVDALISNLLKGQGKTSDTLKQLVRSLVETYGGHESFPITFGERKPTLPPPAQIEPRRSTGSFRRGILGTLTLGAFAGLAGLVLLLSGNGDSDSTITLPTQTPDLETSTAVAAVQTVEPVRLTETAVYATIEGTATARAAARLPAPTLAPTVEPMTSETASEAPAAELTVRIALDAPLLPDLTAGSTPITTLPPGATLTVVGQSADGLWLQGVSDGLSGWIARDVVNPVDLPEDCISLTGDSVPGGQVVFEVPGHGFPVVQTQPISARMRQYLAEIGVDSLDIRDRSAGASHLTAFVSGTSATQFRQSSAYTNLIADRCRWTVIMPWINDLVVLERPGVTDVPADHVRELTRLIDEINVNNPNGHVLVMDYYRMNAAAFRVGADNALLPENVGQFNAALQTACERGGAFDALGNVACLSTWDVFADYVNDEHLAMFYNSTSFYSIVWGGFLGEQESAMFDVFFTQNAGAVVRADGVHLSEFGKSVVVQATWRRLAELDPRLAAPLLAVVGSDDD